MTTVITLLSLVTLSLTAALDLSEVGTCRSLDTLKSADVLEKFVTDEGGTWQYRMIPETEEAKTISWMTMKVAKGQQPGTYIMKTSYQIKSYKTIPEYEDSVKTDDSGQVVSADQKAIVFKVLKYKPKEYAYCYRCVASKGKDGVDQRFVLAHSALSQATQDEIRALDKKTYNFKDNLWNIV